MSSILISSMVFVVVFSGALAGMGLRRVLPEDQLGPETKDIIRQATGLLVTMTALVLGMLVSAANSSYQDRKNELAEMGSSFALVDGLLTSYGPETETIRLELRRLAESGLERIWPSHASETSQLRPQRQTANCFMTNCRCWHRRMRHRLPSRKPLFPLPSTYGTPTG